MNLQEMNNLLAQIRIFNDEVAIYCRPYSTASMNGGVQRPLVSLLESIAKRQAVLEELLLSTGAGRHSAISSVDHGFRTGASLAHVLTRMSLAAKLTDDDIIQVGMLLDGHMQCLCGSLESGQASAPGP